eukprot:1160915-Pelagomonas_calceolata.AAC.1
MKVWPAGLCLSALFFSLMLCSHHDVSAQATEIIELDNSTQKTERDIDAVAHSSKQIHWGTQGLANGTSRASSGESARP